MLRRPLLLALLVLPALAFAAPPAASEDPEIVAAIVVPYSLTVDGQTATGLLATPANPNPTVLVVLCHGFGGNAAYFNAQLADLSNRGYLAVAMDYRGAQGAWKVWTGWRDTVAATLDLQSAYPSVGKTILWGISMGGEVSGLAVAYAPPGTYDYWVDDAGVQNLAEEWAEVPSFQGAIQAETGGTPAQVPEAYVARSPALKADLIAAHGLTRAFFVHYGGDTVVPITHAHETAKQLAALGQPVSFYTVPGAAHAAGGYPFVIEKTVGRPDWPAPVIEGAYAPVGFVPAISPP